MIVAQPCSIEDVYVQNPTHSGPSIPQHRPKHTLFSIVSGGTPIALAMVARSLAIRLLNQTSKSEPMN